MSWRQPDLFCGDKQPHRTLRPERIHRQPPRSAPASFAWESMGAWVRLMHRLFALEAPSSDHYRRTRDTARELTVARIRICRHDDDLARVEQMLVEARSGWLYGLDRAFTRAERGELLVEVRNRRRLLELGRAFPKPKGARFDLARLAQQALDRLTQSHPDAGLVDRLWAERLRRTQLSCNDIGTTDG
ncbi:hypothetical protein [Sphingomonas bacterium]|uniref:hypothetical protein n=1 Tax=Sphingomonas bacterium TaxID=1895847 RepID=UPI001574F3F0|nr:hypothetical protein [Sphingomonas bacterium]